jgi:hypothetical protein
MAQATLKDGSKHCRLLHTLWGLATLRLLQRETLSTTTPPLFLVVVRLMEKSAIVHRVQGWMNILIPHLNGILSNIICRNNYSSNSIKQWHHTFQQHKSNTTSNVLPTRS